MSDLRALKDHTHLKNASCEVVPRTTITWGLMPSLREGILSSPVKCIDFSVRHLLLPLSRVRDLGSGLTSLGLLFSFSKSELITSSDWSLTHLKHLAQSLASFQTGPKLHTWGHCS